MSDDRTRQARPARALRPARGVLTFVAVALGAAALAAGVLVAPSPAADPPPPGALTTTGPTPPPHVRPATGARSSAVEGPGEHLIAGVPAYLWRDGCGPTSVGMVVGYYDTHGFAGLIAGDASTQTTAASQSIASHRDAGSDRHYEDYSLPKETGSAILPDRSAAPAGDEHASDSVADFMHTSWSADGLAYGWSYSNMVGPSFVGFAQLKLTGVTATYRSYYYAGSGSSALTFAVLQQEVDAGRPMVFIVDSSGDGTTDHAIAAIGYRETNGYPEYACWDTWSTTVRWARFQGMSSSYTFGVWGATALSLTANASPSPSPSPSISSSPSASPSASPIPSPSPSPRLDSVAPVTTVRGADAGWHRAPVTLSFAAADDDSGVDFVETDADGAGWSALPSLPGTLLFSGQGTHEVEYRAVDLAGNLETARSCRVRIDTEGPLTGARRASARRGQRLTLRYRIEDLTAKARVRIVIRTLAGGPRKTLRLGLRGTNAVRSCRWRCSLPRGSYRYFVYATDQAGNRQARLGSAGLVVR